MENIDLKNFDVEKMIASSKSSSPSVPSVQIKEDESSEPTVPNALRRASSKQRKASLEEYKDTFLHVPKLEDRKPVFISCEVRDRLDEIVRKLGSRKMSVSGFIENLARHHLELYHEDVESWKKL